MKKSFIAAFFAATMAVSGLGSMSAYASVFSDINSVPWPEAAQYIDEAYSLGLMAGYVENGQRYCKPNNNVTYCEAVQLMYAIMSSYSGTSVSSSVVTKWTSTMAAENIPSWAYNAVAYALENSILSKNDISIFMASSSTQNNARREDVAVIFGKALSKVYSLSSSPTLTYADKDQIASTSIPYVELLNRLNIMVGDANNKFNPRVNINRAEMSVLVTKTYNKLKSGGGTTTTTPGTVVQYSGKVTEKTSSGSGYSITLSSNGTTQKFTTNASTTVTGVSGSASSVSKISTGDSIVAVCNGGVATTIIVMSEGTESTTTKSGSINNITEDEIVLKTSSGNKTYDIEDSDITVTIDGSNSSLTTLVNRFKGGRNYTVTLSLDSDDVVTKIVAKEGTDTGDYDKDAIKSISTSYIKTYNDDRYDFPDDIDEDVSITLDDDDIDYDELKDAFNDLDDDEQMIVDYYKLDSDDELTRLDIVIEDLKTTSSSSSDKKGLVTSISTSRVEINDKDKYDFADVDDIDTLKLDGEKYDTDDDGLDDFVSDIKDEDDVYIELTLDKNDEITEAVAYTCDTKDGDLTDVSSSEIEIDDKYTYDYDSSTSINVKDGNSTISTKSKLEDAFDDDKVMEVTVVYNDDDEVVAITGYVREIEADIDTFEYDSDNDSDECYLKLDTSTSSVKYYFDDAWDIDDIGNLYDDYDNGDDKATIVLNDEGKIKNNKLDLRS